MGSGVRPQHDEATVRANVKKLVAAGAPEQDIHDYLEAAGYPEQTDSSTEGKLSAMGNVRGTLASAYQGFTFGLGDKLTAATRAVLPQAMGGTKGFDYSGALKDERAQLDRFRSERPYVAAAAEGVGGAVPALATMGASEAPTLLNTMRTGAGYGAMYGAGEQDSPRLDDLVRGSAKGAAVGALAGGAVHTVAHAPGRVLDYAGVRPSETSTSAGAKVARALGVRTTQERVPDMLLQRLQRGNLTPADVSRTANEAAALGKPAMLMEAGGSPMVRLARGAQGVPSRGATDIETALQQRRSGAPARVSSDVEAGLGVHRANIFELSDHLAAQQRQHATPLYDAALSAPPLTLDTPVPDTKITLRDLLKRPSSQKALSYEGQLAKEEGRESLPDFQKQNGVSEISAKMSPEAQARFAQLAKDQGIELSPSVTMEQLHNLKLRLDEMLGYAKSRGQLPDGTPATRKMLGAIQETKNHLLSLMDKHAPAYADARRAWGGDAELQDALEMGKEFLGKDARVTTRDIAGLSDAGKLHFRIGAADAIQVKLDAAQDGADVTRKIFGNALQRAKLRAAFPSDEAFGKFEQQMKMEAQMAKNENTVLGNSATAEKQSDVADVTGGTPPYLYGLSPRSVANFVIRSRMAGRMRGLAEKQVDALAPYLTAGSGRPGTRSLEDVIRELESHTREGLPGHRARRALIAETGGHLGGAAGHESAKP